MYLQDMTPNSTLQILDTLQADEHCDLVIPLKIMWKLFYNIILVISIYVYVQ